MSIARRVDVIRELVGGRHLHTYSMWRTPNHMTVQPITMRKLYEGGFLEEVPIKTGSGYDEELFNREYRVNPKRLGKLKELLKKEEFKEERERERIEVRKDGNV